MAQRDGKLKIELVDVFGAPLQKEASVALEHYRLSDRESATWNPSDSPLEICNLRRIPEGRYWINVRSSGYCPVSHMVSIKASGDTQKEICCPINPDAVKEVTFPNYDDLPEQVRTLLESSREVTGFGGKWGETLYESLEDKFRAGLLNVTTKSEDTKLVNGRSVLSYISELRSLRGDRFFATVDEDLDNEVWSSDGIFERVDGSLHRLPPKLKRENFQRSDSFKTYNNYGNLQLTFFRNDTATIADLDIDDARGLKHMFQVMRNWLEKRETHPYDIHQILIRHQALDPGYTLRV